jgi:predicted glycosyltransferase
MTPRPALLFYTYHGLGLGHLVRSWTLAMELRRHFRVVLLTGGPVPVGLTPPSDIDFVSLPTPAMRGDGQLDIPDPLTVIQAIQERRRQIVLETYRRWRPSLIMVELFPFGREQLASELLPMLDQARRRRGSRPLVVCSLRDVLVSRGNDQMAHDERARTWADRYFDAIFVHADPRLVRLEETFRPSSNLRVPFYYTGFVVKTRHESLPAPVPEILVSAGGGWMGGTLFRSAVQAHTILWRRTGLGMRIVAGPFVPEPIWQELVEAARLHPGLRVDRTVPNLALALQGCAASVSQCGYNTAFELVQSRAPSLVVPFAEDGEDEQMNRARRLEHLGLLRVLDPEALTAEALAAAIEDTLSFRPGPYVLRMRGAAVTSRFLSRRVGARLIRPAYRSAPVGP